MNDKQDFNFTFTAKEVCNLGRLPVSIVDNPLFQTCLEISKNKLINYESTTLFNHYNKEKLLTLKDFYAISTPCALEKYSYKNAFLPGYHTKPVTKYKDVAFIKRDNYFGKKQFKKLKSLLESVNRKGYTPEKYSKIDRKKGQITGYFLVDEEMEIKRFYVVSGNHRTAVVNFSNNNKGCPAIFERAEFMKLRDKENCGFAEGVYPNYFSLNNIESWPSVRSKFISSDVAKQIFRRYILA